MDFQWNLKGASDQARTEMVRMGLPAAALPDHYALLRNTALALAEERGLDKMETARRIDAIYDRYDVDALSRWSLQPGVAPLLPWLKGKQVKLGLVSNICRMAIEQALARFGVGGFFDCVVTRDDVEKMKPSGEGIHRALEQLGARPSEALFVGDSVSDIQAAQDAGVQVAIVQGGESAPASLIAAGPTFLWANIHELETVYTGGDSKSP